MAAYTALDQKSLKASGTLLETDAVVGGTPASALLVCTAYDDNSSEVHPREVLWGNRLLANRPPALTRNPAAIDVGMSLWVQRRIKSANARLVTARWNESIAERAMLVGEVSGKNRIDEATGANFATATDAPITGATAALAEADEYAVAYFVSEGPDTNDSFGTFEILNGGVWTAAEVTHRHGTNGAPPLSNVTITMGGLQLTSAQATNARLVGATSRRYTCGIVTLMTGKDTRAAISPSDFADIEDIVASLSPLVDPEDIVFGYNYVADYFEAMDRNDLGTVIAHWDGGDWILG